ncbi:hypothetical protein GY45DRAFT_1321882 [Cubamyces sp. BRFM 1775]|nr:hypothetical protein GY45DRAFT_1321882 [Cubamyces sp. BRFM 1775]
MHRTVRIPEAKRTPARAMRRLTWSRAPDNSFTPPAHGPTRTTRARACSSSTDEKGESRFPRRSRLSEAFWPRKAMRPRAQRWADVGNGAAALGGMWRDGGAPRPSLCASRHLRDEKIKPGQWLAG